MRRELRQDIEESMNSKYVNKRKIMCQRKLPQKKSTGANVENSMVKLISDSPFSLAPFLLEIVSRQFT